MKNYAVLLASGTGERLENPLPKQFLKVAGRTLVEHTLEIFERHSRIDGIIIVVHRDYRSLMEEILLKNHFTKVIKLINGGKSRQESSFFGVNSLPEGEE
ncbi:MAG TPA: 2-C-methyl-D-erythritol 4-phosphate cytidylyltransferase, partial [Candidatus Aminicenantes bacterium]|nr:2-C-methyl-D-erythritol 4-phosphate cytidylyltransferase [Candidatus Aminicenantes bacterium]